LLQAGETAGVRAEGNELNFFVRIDAVAGQDDSRQDLGRVAEGGEADFLSG
jgi:hypothetical protein